ncbi:hypothetical protein [Parasphingorhabdus sp.]
MEKIVENLLAIFFIYIGTILGLVGWTFENCTMGSTDKISFGIFANGISCFLGMYLLFLSEPKKLVFFYLVPPSLLAFVNIIIVGEFGANLLIRNQSICDTIIGQDSGYVANGTVLIVSSLLINLLFLTSVIILYGKERKLRVYEQRK